MPVIIVPQTYVVDGITFSQDDVNALQALFPLDTFVTMPKELVRDTPAVQKAILAGVCLNNGVNNTTEQVTLYLSPDGCDLLGLAYVSPPPPIPDPIMTPQDITYLQSLFVTDMATVPQQIVRNSITLEKAIELDYVVSNIVNPTAVNVVLNLSQAGRAFLGRV